MLARDFCYWLQGHFELNPAKAKLDSQKTDLVQKHLELVFAHDTRSRGTLAYEFCTSLKGHFRLNPGQQYISAEQVKVIRAALNNVFQHEIDPAMGGKAHQDKLNNIHAAPYRPDRPGEILLRC